MPDHDRTGRFICPGCSHKLSGALHASSPCVTKGTAGGDGQSHELFSLLGDDVQNPTAANDRLNARMHAYGEMWAKVFESCSFALKPDLVMASGECQVPASIHGMLAAGSEVAPDTSGSNRDCAIRELLRREREGIPGPFRPCFIMGVGYVLLLYNVGRVLDLLSLS